MYIPKYNLLGLYNVTFLFFCVQGWLSGTEQPVGTLFPGEDHCFTLRIDALWAFPIHFGISVDVILVQLIFSKSCAEDFMIVASDNTGG